MVLFWKSARSPTGQTMTDATSHELHESGTFRAGDSAVNWWQATASAALGGCGLLSGIVITGMGFWLIGAKDFVKRAEVSDMIAREGPYIEDKKLLHDTLQQNTNAISKLSDVVSQMTKEQGRLAAFLERMDRPTAGK